MDLHRISYPLAISTDTGTIVGAEEVPNGLNCNCHCHFCNEPLVAVNSNGKVRPNKQKDHFRHHPKTKCTADYETYIHWLAKDIIKGLVDIALPCINTDNIYDREFLQFRNAILTKYGLNWQQSNLKVEKIQEVTRLQIKHFEIEKKYKTNFGDVIPDIIIHNSDQELFLEPYYSNPVDDDKKRKLEILNKSAISINLVSFVEKYGLIFTLDQFRDFIQNDTSHKKWIVIRAEKIQTLRTKFLRELDNKLSSKPEIINEYIQNKKKEEILSNKIGDYQMQVHRLSAKISDLRDRRKDINLDLGIVD